ncbi:MAG: NAD(P)/FAD-dependent oxidoreductase, partial [Candidatus Eremiobacteraeota bacterium]|nr:NAD(P)/FAD-dependent oxidoreductase [Candidatus Eremiobacteraeota bacterium]
MDVEVAIVGAGFSGIGMAMQLDRCGRGSYLILEREADVGGIWRDNVYPGCACDIPSMLYSFSFAPRVDWTRRYPSQAEIWSYLRDCAERHDLRSRIRFGWDLAEARYDDGDRSWFLRSAEGATLKARILVLATGALNRPALPNVPGLERFQGTIVHSSRWDASVDLRNRDVA